VRFDARRVQRDIDHLALAIGPREATSRSYARTADWVQRRLEGLGYEVRRTTVTVPAGNSWGTPVRRGTSVNVVAERPGFDRRSRHVVVGAHLDTVPVAPGAEDNASGVAVLLELARLAAARPPAVPVQFVAFAAEEPRGPGDALHHFGSRQLVADLSRAERRAVAAMVSLDRVGVRAGYVPVCRGGDDGTRLRAAIRAVGHDTRITTRACENRSSDHWSYEKAGMAAVRIGSVPYAGYHSRRDVPSVVSRDQLDRVGRLVWSWLS
jgi:Iap family predicted aminopeptidase